MIASRADVSSRVSNFTLEMQRTWEVAFLVDACRCGVLGFHSRRWLWL